MITKSDHRESWTVTIEREPGDEWPDIKIWHGKPRMMHATRIYFTLNRGYGHMRVQVSGLNYLKNGQTGQRAEREHWPEKIPWVMALVREARERLGLVPEATGVPW